MANWLDRTIGFFNPDAGARRLVSRRKMDLLDELRSYQAAKRGRLNAHTVFKNTDANSVIIADGPRLRARAYDLVRNNGIAKKIVADHVNFIVGNGIMPRFETGKPELNEQITELFEEFSKRCHPEGSVDFYGMQKVMVGGMVTGGFMMARQRIRRKKDGLKVPLQIQLLEPEFLDNTQSTPKGGPLNTLIGGIELDAIGARRGYWLYASHPDVSRDFGSLRKESNFIPADEVAMLFEVERDQLFGASWLAPVINDIADAGDYLMAEGVRKKIEACHVGVVIPGDDDDDSVAIVDESETAAGLTDMSGNPINRFEPGMFAVLRGGKDIKFNTPPVSAGMEQYLRTKYRLIASGSRLPYELLTGDYGDSNFASGKLALLAYKRFVESIQWQFVIPQFCSPVVQWFLQVIELSGLIQADTKVKVDWDPPAFESITRLDDARADLLEVRMGKRSLQEVIASTGRDPIKVVGEIATMNKLLDDNEVVLDSDPRRVSNNGQMQWQSADSKNGQNNAQN